MMRSTLLATLVLSPMMLNAQASSPAQPAAPVLQSKLVRSPNLNETDTAPAAVPGAPAVAHRISTGVVRPKLLSTMDLAPELVADRNLNAVDRTAIVGMVVDQHGKAADVHMVQSAGEDLDKRILAAVAQYQFKPGTVSGQPTDVPLNLKVVVRAYQR